MTPAEEAEEFLAALVRRVPHELDGRETILQMKAADFQWRQMEWIGFAFELLGGGALREACGAGQGPTFGRTAFDVRREYVWDLKVHPDGASGPVLNDREATDLCITQYGGVGFIIAEGTAVYDIDGTFKSWHDALKGGRSAYEVARVARGASSRRRKVALTLSRYDAYWFGSATDLADAVLDRRLGFFQEGMRNSNGNPRRAKYQIRDLGALRRSGALVASAVL